MVLGKLKQFVPTCFKRSGKIGKSMSDMSLYGYRGDIDKISEPSYGDIEMHGNGEITDVCSNINKHAAEEYNRQLRRYFE